VKASANSIKQRLAPIVNASRATPAKPRNSAAATTPSITVFMREPIRPPALITSAPAIPPALITAMTAPSSWALPVRAST